tara:strand:- start:18993 stop:19292 length:300 start_codon:yes stop_codon:yes gene_type:complete
MNFLDRVKIGDLRAISLMDQGLSMCSVGVVLGVTFVNVRDRLARLERAYGKILYVRRNLRTSSSNKAELTRHGKIVAKHAAQVLEIMDNTNHRSDQGER